MLMVVFASGFGRPWLVLLPIVLVVALPMAIIVGVILALIPVELWKVWKTTKRLNEEAARYGMTRLPGETNRELKLRIVRSNMIKEVRRNGGSTK